MIICTSCFSLLRTTAFGAMIACVPALANAQSSGESSAPDSVIYGLDGTTGTLVRCDLSTGDASDVGAATLSNGTVLTGLNGLAYQPSSTHVYSMWNLNSTSAQLVRIHMTTGQTTMVSSPMAFGNVSGLTYGQALLPTSSASCGDDLALPASSTILADSDGVDAYDIALVEFGYNSDGTSSWTYRVSELAGGKDLSHWDLALDPSHVVVDGTTSGYDLGIDGSTGYFGIKWDVEEDFTGGSFTIVLDQHYLPTESSTGVLAKGGPSADLGEMMIPSVDLVTLGEQAEDDSTLSDPSLFAIASSDDGAAWLVQIDHTTGNATPMQQLEGTYANLSIMPDGTFVASHGTELRSIDLSTGSETAIGQLSYDNLDGLEYRTPDPTSDDIVDELWGYSSSDHQLITVNAHTASTINAFGSISTHNISALIVMDRDRDPALRLIASLFD